MLQDLARVRERQIRLNKVPEHSDVIKGRVKELIDKILKPLIQLEELAGNPDANPPLTRYCQWADGLEAQFSCTEHLVEEGWAFFDTENLQRLKSIPLSEVSTRFMQSVRWKGDSVITKRK
jgi:hypothetical protein